MAYRLCCDCYLIRLFSIFAYVKSDREQPAQKLAPDERHSKDMLKGSIKSKFVADN